MSNEFIVLVGTAITLGFVHTVLGPDHYLPFIALSKVRRWNTTKTAMITLLCGIGHILSSVVLGFIGIALGVAVYRLEAIESFRGEMAAWLLIIFGFTYFIWGMHRAIRGHPHEHFHQHEDGDFHTHTHKHIGEHAHIHGSESGGLTPWVLFTIFVFGPCEPLIPVLMYPAAMGSMMEAAIVASAFGLTTIATMLCIVLASFYGLSRLPLHRAERYSHASAGLTIFLCGIGIMFLGL